MNVKWSLKAVEALNLDPMRSSQLNVLMKIEQPYELAGATERARIESEGAE